jgi:hypothetical protein
MTEQTAKVFVTQSTTGRRVELDLRVPASTSQPPAAVELLEKVKLAFGPGTLENVERTQIVASGTTITNRAEFVWYPAQGAAPGQAGRDRMPEPKSSVYHMYVMLARGCCLESCIHDNSHQQSHEH